jgi:hypothetical protein
MQLYKIEYDQLTLVSVFDEKGTKIGNKEERIRLSMNDLPLQTAQMYRDKMKGLNFVMTAQALSRDEPRTRKQKKIYEREARTAAPKTVTPQKSREEQLKEAAQSGDMAAAINMRSK